MQHRQRLPEKKSKITLKEVARHAGVGESTVSRIMRKDGSVSEATRLKVMEAVRATGYVPNRIAGSLASLNSHLVGVVIPSLSNIVFPEVLQGIHAGLKQGDYQPVISTTEYDVDLEEDVVRGLLAWKPAAILIAGFDHTDATRRMLVQSDIRIVEMMDIDAVPIDIAVGMSHRRAGYVTGKHLVARGYRHFGYVGHDWNADRRAHLRYEGIVQALSDSGLAIEAHAIAEAPSSVGVGREMTARIRAEAPGLDVVIYSNDDMAVGGAFYCLGAGISMPDQLAIFGFNGLDIGRELPQPLSTIRSNRFLIGRTAVEKAFESRLRPPAPAVVDTGFEVFDGATA
ncbi:LacI family DNA-binding transcriptional regulator [Phyllobacterium myrsinacearum]|uniref:LacI family gluconate utilization system Gnt-I transcriptional repressor n=1 Tax=Phyllobacterium myrsinacearum TaxID=28101 RepID=A0A839EP05_9HYPH|nr:LacI family DNA-binding transcriptional regulator [Phyllobacterium myrsinacearum]MBA8879905.1 LacI family gluconate utilization system Gnt-I transcriptional repressor [Phyllobacterium myrsinacearum]